jgi:hypothetical protein
MDDIAAIAMPDHLHLLMSPLERDASVFAFSKWFKRWFDEQCCRPFVPGPTNRFRTNGNIYDRILFAQG